MSKMKKYEIYRSVLDIADKYNLGRHCFIGKGSEGRAYKVGNEVVKLYNSTEFTKDIKYSKVITTQDIKSSSFVFPKKLFIVDDILVGYIYDYYPNDILQESFKNPNETYEIDLERLKRSYDKMYRNLSILTNDGIAAFDLACNILYNGESIKAIDTIKYAPSTEACKNFSSLDKGLKYYIHRFNRNYGTSKDISGDADINYIDHLVKKYGSKIYNR